MSKLYKGCHSVLTDTLQLPENLKLCSHLCPGSALTLPLLLAISAPPHPGLCPVLWKAQGPEEQESLLIVLSTPSNHPV